MQVYQVFCAYNNMPKKITTNPHKKTNDVAQQHILGFVIG
jgi:hypothetical protein